MQGLGAVSFGMLEFLSKEGAMIIGCDVDADKVKLASQKYGIEAVSTDSIYDVQCDIFSPCALGATINPETLPRIRAKIIAGAANNQLSTDEMGYEVMKRGIVYAPDYAINAGGLTNIYHESMIEGGYNKDRAFAHTAKIRQTIELILERAAAEKLPTSLVADRIAQERVAHASKR
jgi:leucine dehydrogenase